MRPEDKTSDTSWENVFPGGAVNSLEQQTNDVIAAVATPAGTGATGMVRLSGRDAAAVLSRIFLPKRTADAWESHRMYYGRIHDHGEIKDEVLCCVMRAPRSYTGEDCAEIYTHGGQAVVRAVLEAALRNGARPAEAGEYTKRAFLHGRIDLTQAEAVTELINAKTDAARKVGLRQLGGGLSEKIKQYREVILQCLAHIELSIDYPEHEEEAMNLETVSTQCTGLIKDMEKLLETAKTGRILKNGVKTVIVGRPNVGKSSLLNAILREDRAIVTEIPGTTRDVLSEWVSVGGVPLILSDTAGIRETNDEIERLGVLKTWEQADSADLILLMADRSTPPLPEDLAMLRRYHDRTMLLLLNKCDLPPAEGWAASAAAIEISAKNGVGLDLLFQRIKELFLSGMVSGDDTEILTRERHKFLLEQALLQLRKATNSAASGVPEDLISVDLTAAYRSLGEIIGAEIGEDIIDRIFSEFCVGK